MPPVDPTMAGYAANHNSSPSAGHSPKMTGEGLPKTEQSSNEPRLIVVSNRLPVTISKDDQGNYSFKVRYR